MHEIAPASPWVMRFLEALKPFASGDSGPGCQALDVACGSGRHIAACRAVGLHVVALDRDVAKAAAFASNPFVTLREADLEDGSPFPAPPATFAVVIVANYLWRPILPDIVGAVGPAGMLIYETFALGNERFGKPSNPDFLLRPGELLAAVTGTLIPIAYEHVRLEKPDRLVQRICAVSPDHEWLTLPPAL